MSEENDPRPGWGIPRRACIDKLTPAELSIRDAVAAVEALPPDERLTRAVILLGNARDLVADFVDGVPLGEGYPRPAPLTDEERSRMTEGSGAALARSMHGVTVMTSPASADEGSKP